MIDTSELLKMVAELSEQLENLYGEDCELGEYAVVYEVASPSGNWTQVGYRCSDTRVWVQSGLFHAADRAVWSMPPMVQGDGDE